MGALNMPAQPRRAHAAKPSMDKYLPLMLLIACCVVIAASCGVLWRIAHPVSPPSPQIKICMHKNACLPVKTIQ